MGPNLILDKSALQALSQGEIYRLAAHYNMVTCPILLIEILGDLKKGTTGGGLALEQVQHLADKVLCDSFHPPFYLPLVWQDLAGRRVPMTGQVPMVGGKEVVGKGGQKGIVFAPTPENEALLRWRDGLFNEGERALGRRWRESARALDLEGFQRRNRKTADWHRFKNLDNLHRYVWWITHPKVRSEAQSVLTSLLDNFEVPVRLRDLILRRWQRLGWPDLDQFAPYAYHCFKVNLVFQYGVITGLITTRPTNRVDIEYMYYVPFCDVFCSRDQLHKELSVPFLRTDQSFADGDELKSDLRHLIHWWKRLDAEQQRNWSYEYGSYPPENQDSLTYRLWRRHLMPWRPGMGNLAGKMSQEEQEELLGHIRELVDGGHAPADG